MHQLVLTFALCGTYSRDMSEEISTVLSRAEQLLQGRRDAISGLERAADALTEAKAAVAAAEKGMSDAVAEAKAAGWTVNELKQLGLPVTVSERTRSGSKRGSARSRGRTAAASSTSPTPTASQTIAADQGAAGAPPAAVS